MSNIAEKKIEEYPRYVIGGNNPYNRGYNAGYKQAMQDSSEKAIIAYCEVCKMPNCVTQNQKETCPYLSKFRRCLKSSLNN